MTLGEFVDTFIEDGADFEIEVCPTRGYPWCPTLYRGRKSRMPDEIRSRTVTKIEPYDYDLLGIYIY